MTSATGLMLIATIFCAVLALLVYHIRRIKLYRAVAKFPGPKTLPIIGNAHLFFGNTEEILNKIMGLTNLYPSLFRIWLGHRVYFAVYDPEHFKAIVLSPKAIDKDDLYKFVRPWMGTGLFTAPAAKWRVHRKLIMPTFNPRILESFVEVFAKQSVIMTEQMEKELNGNEFGIFHYISLCTLDIICETAMGVTVKAQTEENNRYVDSAKRAFEIIAMRIFKVWLHPNFLFNLTPYARDQRECVKYLHSVTEDVIRKKRKLFDEGHRVNNVDSQDGSNSRKAFLDFLMEMSNEGTKFTDEELREEVDTMMLAGNDTTASINSWVVFMLANFPDIQEKVYQELCEIYGEDVSSDVLVKTEDLNRMIYLERVIKETMRLFPIGPLIVRQTSDDLHVGEHVIPKGSSLVLGLLKLHRWEKLWPDPFKFDPDRFLPEEIANRHPYSYVPFSAGPRNCLGVRYAMMAMKVLLATVLRRYVLKKDKTVAIEDIKLKADMMLKPVVPLTIKIEKRQR